jgi:CheY-like chemotaxis protein
VSFPPEKSRRPLVLFIDDDEIVLRIRKLLVAGAGYDVLTATSGDTGLALFQQNPIDLVVADHFLSGSCGTEIAREMKALKPHVPILIASGSAAPPSLEFADGFVSKGEPPAEFLNAIAKLLFKG